MLVCMYVCNSKYYVLYKKALCPQKLMLCNFFSGLILQYLDLTLRPVLYQKGQNAALTWYVGIPYFTHIYINSIPICYCFWYSYMVVVYLIDM